MCKLHRVLSGLKTWRTFIIILNQIFQIWIWLKKLLLAAFALTLYKVCLVSFSRVTIGFFFVLNICIEISFVSLDRKVVIRVIVKAFIFSYLHEISFKFLFKIVTVILVSCWWSVILNQLSFGNVYRLLALLVLHLFFKLLF